MATRIRSVLSRTYKVVTGPHGPPGSGRWRQLLGWRIFWRVRWLRVRQWSGDLRWRDGLRHLPRPILLVAIGAAIPLVVLWWLDAHFPRAVGGIGTALDTLLTGSAGKGGPEQLQWREALQLLLLVVGLPAAFVLWLFRDIHVNETLTNQRKDVNLKEFQEIQMRAAGAIDEKYPADARETLQIAALHQLRSFLRGGYGVSFRRPAWELLRARMAASARETGTRAIFDWVEAYDRAKADPSVTAAERAEKKVAEIRRALAALRLLAVATAERAVIREDHRFIFRADLPLNDSCFDRIDLSGTSKSSGALLASRSFARCSFIGANLWYAHLEGADLGYAHLEGAKLWYAHLERANLGHAHLEGAELGRAYLNGAELWYAHLEGTDLGHARLEGAELRYAHLEGANLQYAHLEEAQLWQAHLEGAKLWQAHLEGAELRYAHLEGAQLWEAHLEGANLGDAHLEDADLEGAWFDDNTIFSGDWDDIAELDRANLRDTFRARGMRHVDDPDVAAHPSDKSSPATS